MNSVTLKAITMPVGDCANDTQELLAYFARVSSAANQGNHATGQKLIKSLIARKEWSPLEMVSLTMEIVTTRDIARQILRHRSFSFQEFSQRYAAVSDDFSLRECRLQDTKDRQNSLPCDDDNLADMWIDYQADLHKLAMTYYNDALKKGIAKEVARAILPEGLTHSRLYMAGTLRSWLHFCTLRSGVETQKEHREIACKARDILASRFPVLDGCFGE